MTNKTDSTLNNDIGSVDDNDSLLDIAIDKIPVLRDLFQTNWPYTSLAYFFIDMVIQWKKKLAELPIQILSPYGRWQNGSFVAILNECKYKVHFFTLEDKPDDLFEALYTTRKINWKHGPLVANTHEKLIEPLMNIFIPKLNQEIEKFLYISYWWLSKENALVFDIQYPPDVYISALTPELSTGINSHWPQVHKFPGSETFLKNRIERNEGLGIFGKQASNLRAWITINEFGALATLQTLEEYKRKGYASLLVKEMSKRRARNGVDTIACALQDNEASIAMFTKLGFARIHDLRSVQFKNTENSTANRNN